MNSGLELKKCKLCLKMFRNFSKKSGGGISVRLWKQPQNLKIASSATVNTCLFYWTCVKYGSSMKHLLSVCSVISLISCLAMNNCIGILLDFSAFLHVVRSFDCSLQDFSNFITQETSYINLAPRHYLVSRYSRS